MRQALVKSMCARSLQKIYGPRLENIIRAGFVLTFWVCKSSKKPESGAGRARHHQITCLRPNQGGKWSVCVRAASTREMLLFTWRTTRAATGPVNLCIRRSAHRVYVCERASQREKEWVYAPQPAHRERSWEAAVIRYCMHANTASVHLTYHTANS